MEVSGMVMDRRRARKGSGRWGPWLRRAVKYKIVLLKMHAIEEETFKWPHFCSILKDFLLQLASREWIRSLFLFSSEQGLLIYYKLTWKSLCNPGWPQIHSLFRLSFHGARIAGVHTPSSPHLSSCIALEWSFRTLEKINKPTGQRQLAHLLNFLPNFSYPLLGS